MQQCRGVMLILASPSGAGKSTLSKLLMSQDDNVELSISVTTRVKRASEVEGVHYHFKTRTEFEALKQSGALLEWAQVHSNFYGTPKAEVEAKLQAGTDILFDIDYQGTIQLYEKCRKDIVSIFILPPSIQELRSRLVRRAEDSKEVIDKRLKNARTEMEHWSEYDYVFINEDVEKCLNEVKSVLASARLGRLRYPQLEGFVANLQAEIDAL